MNETQEHESGTLSKMDLLLVLKGMIAAGQEKMMPLYTDPSVRIPLSLLMRAADEIAVGRDALERLRHASTMDDHAATEPPKKENTTHG